MLGKMYVKRKNISIPISVAGRITVSYLYYGSLNLH